jgi:hypothetical protein
MLLLSRLFIVVASVALVSGCSPLFSETFPYDLQPDNDEFIKTSKSVDISILSSIGLRFTDNAGNKVSELSGIVWDADDSILYAVSDEGMLYHFSIDIGRSEINKNPTIKTVRLINSYPLLARNGSRLKGEWRDSEGLSSTNEDNGKKKDTELIVSFENKPRIARYSVDGKFLGEVKLPKKLWQIKNYRSKNKALESVSRHVKYGVLTAAEYPLKMDDKKIQTLYSSQGKEWHFKASTAKNSAITGLEILSNGHVLVLERAWSGLENALVISLSSIDLDHCGEKKQCFVKRMAILSSADGWLLDDFEGLAHYKNGNYFMVSDDNENAFQSTVLTLFQINGMRK